MGKGGWEWGLGGAGAKKTQKEAREVAVYYAPHAGADALSVAAHAAWPGWPPGLSWPQPLLPLSPLPALSPPGGAKHPSIDMEESFGKPLRLLIQLLSGNSILLSLFST